MTSPLRTVDPERRSGAPAGAPELGLEVAALIPAYQAERTIGEVVVRTLAFCERVLVVDDGSLDATAARAREAGARVASLPANRGKGAALRHGFQLLTREPELDGIVTLDADGQHLPEEIPLLIARAIEEDADLVLGGRDHLFGDMCLDRRWSNRISSAAISWLADRRLGDVQTGFRFYRRRLLCEVPMFESRFEAESAIVVRAGRRGLRIATVPIRIGEVDGRATSHFRPFRDAVRIVGAVLRARFDGSSRRAPR